MKWLFCPLLSLWAVAGSCQDSTTFLTKADSAAVYQQVMAELAAMGFVAPKSASFFEVSVGYGNGRFSQKSYLQPQRPLPSGYFSTNVAYLQRTGFSISANANLIGEATSLSMFQWSFNGAYDFTGKKISAGLSIRRFFNKDSLTFYVSPLVNNIYAYTVLKKGWLEPKLAVDFGWGKYDERENLRYIDMVRFPRLKPLVRSLSRSLGESNVYDISILASAKHNFSWNMGGTGGTNQFTLTPSIAAILGTAKYGSNLSNSNAGGFSSGTLAQLQAQRLQAKYRELVPEPDERFLWQSANASVAALASWKILYIQSQVTIAYAIPEALRSFNAFYTLSVGASF